MRPAVAFFFLLIFSFQVLPLRALGRLLAKAQLTEEVKNSCDADDDDSGCDDDGKDSKDSKEEKDKDESSEKYNGLIIYAEDAYSITPNRAPGGTIIAWTSEGLIHQFTKDIHCPPPNC